MTSLMCKVQTTQNYFYLEVEIGIEKQFSKGRGLQLFDSAEKSSENKKSMPPESPSPSLPFGWWCLLLPKKFLIVFITLQNGNTYLLDDFNDLFPERPDPTSRRPNPTRQEVGDIGRLHAKMRGFRAVEACVWFHRAVSVRGGLRMQHGCQWPLLCGCCVRVRGRSLGAAGSQSC